MHRGGKCCFMWLTSRYLLYRPFDRHCAAGKTWRQKKPNDSVGVVVVGGWAWGGGV